MNVGSVASVKIYDNVEIKGEILMLIFKYSHFLSFY